MLARLTLPLACGPSSEEIAALGEPTPRGSPTTALCGPVDARKQLRGGAVAEAVHALRLAALDRFITDHEAE